MRALRSLPLIVGLLCAVLALALARPSRAAGPNDGLKPDTSVDRATPRRALTGFVAATDRGEYDRAAHYLDLRAIPKAHQEADGAELSEKLAYVLAHSVRIDPSKVSDDPEAEPPAGTQAIVAGTMFVEDDTVPIALTRVKFDDGVSRWVIARTTVAMIPVMYAATAHSPIEDRMPFFLTGTFLGNATWQWLALIVAMPVSFGMATLVVWMLFGLMSLVARRTKTSADDTLIASSRRPSRLAIASLAYWIATGQLHLTLDTQHVVGHLAFTAVVVAVAWFAFGVIAALIDWFEERIPEAEKNDMAHRGARTRLAVFERVAEVLIVVIATAFTLVQFEIVRSIGVSLLASAGIAGVVVGFAAQKSLGGIIAGVHLSITQPIRMGDSIVIEGEFGTVEEINLTYVVVRLWDERRMVVPVGRFLEQPFQNWTKVGSELIGAVTVACDFGTPVERVRTELQRVCSLSPNWDRRTCALQVTEAGERSITLRAVISSANAPSLWDLRCEVRERLVRFLLELEGGRYVARAREEWINARPAPRDDRTIAEA